MTHVTRAFLKDSDPVNLGDQMSDGRSTNGTKPHRPSARLVLFFFALGLAVGITGTITLPGLLRPHLPAALDWEGKPFRGVVSTKQAEADRIILTVSTAEGTIFATFTDMVADIGLLIQEGDSITLELRKYAPFVGDPLIARVLSLSEQGDTLPAADSAATEISDEANTTKADTGAVQQETATARNPQESEMIAEGPAQRRRTDVAGILPTRTSNRGLSPPTWHENTRSEPWSARGRVVEERNES